MDQNGGISDLGKALGPISARSTPLTALRALLA